MFEGCAVCGKTRKLENNRIPNMFFGWFLCGFLSLVCDVTLGVGTVKYQAPTTFVAAVYEHQPFLLPDSRVIVSRQKALEVMTKNLNVYKDQTKKAKQQGAEIIVFPEYGINGMGYFSRKSIYPFLEVIPDPDVIKWSPCSDPDRYPNTEAQFALSCMAKDNGLYLVANMGDRVPCNASIDPKCPADGHYQYNTNVAYGPDGTILAKYHKFNLFYEDYFDKPESSIVYFDTPFGRFGMFTCWDIMFKDPPVTMVTEYNITNIAFLTAWIDTLPLLSAIGFHSSIARGLGVNILAANIHLPTYRFLGSGIYTANGMSAFYYNNSRASPGKLLVSRLASNSPNISVLEKNTEAKSYKFNNEESSQTFSSVLFNDTFTFRLLQNSSGELNVCQRNVCCSLDYELASDQPKSQNDSFAFGAFDGLHTLDGQFYSQICTLVKCAKNQDKFSCGAKTKVSSTRFKSLSISGKFQTSFVHPQVILSEDGQLSLADQKSWTFHSGNTLVAKDGFDSPVLSAALFGRVYSRDNEDYNPEDLTSSDVNDKNSHTRIGGCKFCVLVGILLMLLVF